MMDLLGSVTDLASVALIDPANFLLSGDSGLRGIWSDIRDNWVQPLFVAAVAVFALVFVKDRAWTKLIAFVGIAAVVGVLIFAGEDLFGSKDAGLTKVGVGAANSVSSFNAITPLGVADTLVE